MSTETSKSTAAPAPLTADEFEEFMAADKMILELSLNDFILTLYNYKQANADHIANHKETINCQVPSPSSVPI